MANTGAGLSNMNVFCLPKTFLIEQGKNCVRQNIFINQKLGAVGKASNLNLIYQNFKRLAYV
jgi:hypothetical protein